MSTYKTGEGKREEFRKYLEQTGVMDTLTKVLVSLYEEEEKPEDALAFIRDQLAIQAGLETYAQLQEKIDELQNKVNELEAQAPAGGSVVEEEAGEPVEEPPAEEAAEGGGSVAEGGGSVAKSGGGSAAEPPPEEEGGEAEGEAPPAE